jgi:tRNA (guanine-N7-)-methyltransferase
MVGPEILYSNHDIYQREGSPEEVTEIKTHYESLFLKEDKPITYIKFKI